MKIIDALSPKAIDTACGKSHPFLITVILCITVFEELSIKYQSILLLIIPWEKTKFDPSGIKKNAIIRPITISHLKNQKL